MSRFEYTDPEGYSMHIAPVTYEDGPSLLVLIGDPKGKAMLSRIPLDRVEEVIAGLRDIARQAGGQADAPPPMDPALILGIAPDYAEPPAPRRRLTEPAHTADALARARTILAGELSVPLERALRARGHTAAADEIVYILLEDVLAAEGAGA